MQEDIIKKIYYLFENCLFRDLSRCDNPLSEHIFGENIALLPAEGYYLLTRIEEEFSITFPKEAVINGKFNALEDIVQVIEECIGNKSPE